MSCFSISLLLSLFLYPFIHTSSMHFAAKHYVHFDRLGIGWLLIMKAAVATVCFTFSNPFRFFCSFFSLKNPEYQEQMRIVNFIDVIIQKLSWKIEAESACSGEWTFGRQTTTVYMYIWVVRTVYSSIKCLQRHCRCHRAKNSEHTHTLGVWVWVVTTQNTSTHTYVHESVCVNYIFM